MSKSVGSPGALPAHVAVPIGSGGSVGKGEHSGNSPPANSRSERVKSGKPEPMTAEEKREQDAYVREGLRLLDDIAGSVSRQIGRRYDIDDLKGFAHEAVADVAKRFDPSRGVSFRGYARIRLRGAIFDGLRRDTNLPRGLVSQLGGLKSSDLYVEEKRDEIAGFQASGAATAAEADTRMATLLAGIATAYATGLVTSDGTLGASLGVAGMGETLEVDAEDLMMRAQCRQKLQGAIELLGEPERTILRRHYFHDEDVQDVAADVGLSKSWGSRLHARGIEKLSRILKDAEF